MHIHGAETTAKLENSTMKKQQKAAPKLIQLGIGMVRVYNFDGIGLHAYETRDPFSDQSFLFETPKELIGLESPLFRDNLAEFTAYVRSLKKPLNHLIVANHPAGGKTYTHIRIYSTKTAQKSMESGGPIRAKTDSYASAYGKKWEADYPGITDTIKAGIVNIGGINFVVKDTEESFDLEIPAINAAYTHKAGGKSHNILESREQINAMIAQMEDYWLKNYTLILTAHDIPISAEAAAEKADYLRTVKTLASKSRDKAAFIAAMKAAFPDYRSEQNLEISADFLF
jgi:hypothetical protein